MNFTKSKLTAVFLLVFGIFLGALFHSTQERYIYKTIDLFWSFKKKSICNSSDLITAKSLSRKPIQKKKIIETRDSWIESYKEIKICPKTTAILLIDVWDLEELEHDVVKSVNQKIINETIVPTINKHRKRDGLIIHSANGSKTYPDIINTKLDLDLSWTFRLPHKLQTIMLFWTLKSKGIEKVIYAGFSTNMCLYSRAHGIQFTRKFEPYLDRFLLKEGTSAWEFSENTPNFTENLIKFIEWKHIPTISKKYLN